jgi:hypothetical protein
MAASGSEPKMTTLSISSPLLALLSGIVILIVPRVLNYVVAAYLIATGLIGLFPHIIG